MPERTRFPVHELIEKVKFGKQDCKKVRHDDTPLRACDNTQMDLLPTPAHSFDSSYTLTTSLRSHPAAEGNVLSVPRARCGGSTNAADALRLRRWLEPAPESESETEPSLSCSSIPHHAGGGSTGVPLYSNGLSNIEARRRGHGASISCSRVETTGRSWHE